MALKKILGLRCLVKRAPDPEQMPIFAASELGLLCLLMSQEWVSGQKRDN